MFENSDQVSAFAFYSKLNKNETSNDNKRKISPKKDKPKRKKQKSEDKTRQINGIQKKDKQIMKVVKKLKTNNDKMQKKTNESKSNDKIKKKTINDKVARRTNTKPTISPNEFKKAKILTKISKSKNEKRKLNKQKLKSKICTVQKSSSGSFYVDNNSIKAGEKMFGWVINPIELNQFYKDNWEKQPIIIQRNCPKYYSHLLTCEDINKALRKQQLHFTKNIDITSYTPETGIRETHNPPGRATAPLVWDFYSNGCSIRILNPQTFFPKVHALNTTLQEYFGCFVGANVYLTPADSQGFAPHYDDIEAFVLQLEGEKMWKLYAPRNFSETLPRFSSGNFTDKDLGEPIQEVLLKAGDMMYFPRGFIHQGVALGNKHSLHITLSVYQKNSWADFLETLLPAALKCAIEEDVTYREGLPMQYLSHLGLVHSDKSSEIRNKFMEKMEILIKKLVEYAPVDAAVDQLAKKFIHDSLPPFLRQDEKETTVFEDGETILNGEVINQAEMCLDSRIKLVRYNCIRMLREEDAIRIYYSVSNSKEYHQEDAQFLEIDEDLAPAVEAIISAYPDFITVEDLPIDDDIAKVQIASDLWENGILMTEEPLSYMSE